MRELEAWIARNVRFDVGHAATTAPLDFGPVAERVEQAQAKPGRGKKVVAITFDYRVADGARSEERTFGREAWKRADEADEDAPACDHAVLGVVAAGPHYGQAFDVCVAKDKCEVHWKAELKAKEKARKLREQGDTAGAEQTSRDQRAALEQQRQEAEAKRKAWDKLRPLAVTAVAAHIQKAPIKAILPAAVKTTHRLRGQKIATADAFVRAIAAANLEQSAWDPEQLARDTKAFGFNLHTWITEQEASSAAKKPAPAKATTKKAATKKPAKRKASR